MADYIVNAVRKKMRDRSEFGLAKYGTNMMRTDLTLKDWLVHAQEEAMDLAVYLERIIREVDKADAS